MTSSKALWRRVFDTAEQSVTPKLEALVRTEEFSHGAALALRLMAAARWGAAAVSSRLWHSLNLPAGTDVQRVRWQLGAMDRELRRLGLRLDQLMQDEAGPLAIQAAKDHGERE
jgi:hypothetical protein